MQTMGRRWMILAVCVAAAWGLLLAGMALFTADRVTLNREQIRRADFLVTATVRDDEGLVAVEKEWKRENALEGRTIRLENLAETGARTNRTYLIPVSRTADGRFRVTETPPPRAAPMIYPATDETFEQVRKLPAGWLHGDGEPS